MLFRSRKDIQGLDPFVFDERLLESAVALDDIDEVVHDPPLATHDEVQIAQADVEIDDGDFFSAACEAARETGRGSRLPDATLT